ncbi:MAG: CHASE2 domain-containing protein [Cyanothece sp. SIO2G6]|nr:CHASE2 domain-containing protein [Cyanothece sp. SIO2G6]
MNKLVILQLDKDLNQTGFRVSLEVGEDGQYPDVSLVGHLPLDSDLFNHARRWRKSYAALSMLNRAIKPIEVVYGNKIDPVSTCNDDARLLAFHFKKWLASSGFRLIENQLRYCLSSDDLVRILIRTNEQWLYQLPWHLWDVLTDYPRAEIAFSSPAFQRIHLPRDRTAASSLRILAICGYGETIDASADYRVWQTFPGANITTLVEPRRQEIGDRLWDQPWDILFFAGHSHTEWHPGKESIEQQGRIFLNPTEHLTLQELEYGLRQAIAQGLQLAFFNSCDGLGLAYALESLNLPQMIVMRESVPDPVAQKFLQYFLSAFSNGNPIHLATREARERLQSLEGEFPCASWLPILFQHPVIPPLAWPTASATLAPAPAKAPSLKPSKRSQSWQKKVAIATIPLLVTTGVAGLRMTGWLQGLELWAFDRLMALRSDEADDSRLLIVEVTEDDVQTLGYPLSDQVLTRLLTTLDAAKPAVIGLDIFRDISRNPGYADLSQHMEQSDRLIAVCQHPSATTDGIAPPLSLSPEQIGFNDVVLDVDQVVRRHLLVMHPRDRSQCTTNIAFSLMLAIEYLKQQGLEIGTKDGFVSLDKVVLRPLDGPFNVYSQSDLAGHQLLLNYRLHQRSLDNIAQRVSISKVLDGVLPPIAIRDRIVLIGITAPEPKDDFMTPQQSTLRGLILHAQMVSQLVSAVMDDRPLLWSWQGQGTLLWIATWSIVGTTVTIFSQLIIALQKINKFWVITSMLMVLLIVSRFFFLLGG